MLKKFAALVLSAGLFFGLTAPASAAPTNNQPVEKPIRKIVINSASRMLSLYDGSVRIEMFPLGLGKPSTPTPVGYYKINTKEIDPPWIDPSNPEYEIPSGESNPLGYRWMQIWGNYGIHGTNRPDSIGHYVSNGCVRMREADVERLFDKVDIGTPVEITYNRVVVEKNADDEIVYYIYPDGYGWQPIDATYVNKWLAPYGVSAFESDADIEKKIYDSDGEPTYIAKAYTIELNGRRVENFERDGRTFDSKAVVREGITYLPAVPIAMASKTKLEWRAGESTLRTSYGEVVGIERKRQLYLNADDAIVLFSLDGGLQNVEGANGKSRIYRLQTVERLPIPDEPDPKDKKKRKKSDEKSSTEVKPAPTVEPTTEPKPKAEIEPKAEAQSKAETQSKAEVSPKAEVESKADGGEE